MTEHLSIVLPAAEGEKVTLDVEVGPGTPGWDDAKTPGALCEGWVTKCSTGMGMSRIFGKNWRPRYFVLRKGTGKQLNLTYYNKETSAKGVQQKGVVHINDMAQVKKGQGKEKPPKGISKWFFFTLTFVDSGHGGDGKTHDLICSWKDEAERDNWITKLGCGDRVAGPGS